MILKMEMKIITIITITIIIITIIKVFRKKAILRRRIIKIVMAMTVDQKVGAQVAPIAPLETTTTSTMVSIPPLAAGFQRL